MRKYLTLIYITISVMSLAQFKDNVFDHDQITPNQDQNSSSINEPHQAEASQTMIPNDEVTESAMGVPGPGEHEEGPGNPGEPVPIDGYLPILLLTGFGLMVFAHRKNKKVHI